MNYLTHIATGVVGILLGGWFVWFLVRMDDDEKPERTGRIVKE